ncbi:MAG: BlaI/MecI/CopY family transcriptional regulator [Phycisphaerales bacterium]|nr:BlaI/MecI/CopY family transcriptional regulator [Phycisphaerales bacterium]
MADRQYELGAAELEVLSVLWDHGSCTVRQVLEHLQQKGRRLAYTTVLTFLTRLEQKGVVVSDKTGIAYVYRTAVTRDRIRRSRLKALVSQLYDGAAGPLVLQLIKTQKFSPEEIETLQELIKQLDSKRKKE